MSHNEKLDHMQIGLKEMVAELLGRVWVECGPNAIPGMHIWEEARAVEVMRTASEGEYIISLRVGSKAVNFVWNEAMMFGDCIGITQYDFGDLNESELCIAAGLILLYYGQAMAQ